MKAETRIDWYITITNWLLTIIKAELFQLTDSMEPAAENENNKPTIFKCTFCNKIFVLQSDMTYHLEQLHSMYIKNALNQPKKTTESSGLKVSDNETVVINGQRSFGKI